MGRAEDLAALHAFLAQAAAEGGSLLVWGEPGIGKSVLLDHMATVATAAGTAVLQASGVEFLSDLGFYTLTTLLQPVRSRIAELDPGQRDAVARMLGLEDGSVSDQLRNYNAVLALLRLVAAKAPLLLLVDDVHWADRASTAVLAFISRRLTGTRIGLLMASRPDVPLLLSRSGMSQRALAPLAEEDAATLLATRYPLLGPRATRRVLDEAKGNPLALLELPPCWTPRPTMARCPWHPPSYR